MRLGTKREAPGMPHNDMVKCTKPRSSGVMQVAVTAAATATATVTERGGSEPTGAEDPIENTFEIVAGQVSYDKEESASTSSSGSGS